MDYNSRLKELRSGKNQTVDEIKTLDRLNEEELEKTKLLIEEKYSKLKEKPLNEFDKKVEDIHNYCELIEEKSTMSGKIIDIIAELITIFEGEIYSLKKLRYHKNNELPSAVWETHIIMPNDVFDKIQNPDYISERYYHHLLKNNIGIVIEEWSPMYRLDDFSFYKYDKMGRLIPQISFKKFPYIKQFVDYIINYRIENNIEELSTDEMEKLKEDFILLNVDNINDNYKLKQEQIIEEKTKEINAEYEHKQKVLKRIVRKIESKR